MEIETMHRWQMFGAITEAILAKMARGIYGDARHVILGVESASSA
jgi:hypothetical protein